MHYDMNLKAFWGGVVALALLGGQAFAEHAPQSASPVLAELFTSQGCSSCPPAEALFTQLAADPGLVTIEWHVDYWDKLVHGGSRWKDPYSSAVFTTRQRAYNRALRGTAGAYTPQAVIHGTSEVVGNRSSAVRGAIARAAPGDAQLSVKRSDAGYDIKVSGEGAGSVLVVRLLPQHVTAVEGGENKGRTLKGRNIALGATTVGRWRGGEGLFRAGAPNAGETCAVIVHAGTSDAPGPVLAAAYCDGAGG